MFQEQQGQQNQNPQSASILPSTQTVTTGIADTFNNISKDVKTIRQEWLKKVSYNIE